MAAKKINTSARLIKAAAQLADEVDRLTFAPPVTHVYNPLRYAWRAHKAYLSMAPQVNARAVFLGMNPGPWGMAQTGVPFGEVNAVRDWLGISARIDRPDHEHPKRPVQGLSCPRSEVSGRRLWGLIQDRFGRPQRFFADQFIVNYCPLVFMEESARNRTPDKLPAGERERLTQVCDQHLRDVLSILRPKHVVAVGGYAEKCIARAVSGDDVDFRVVRILHPSPASPAANRDWAGTVTGQLNEASVW